MAIYGLNNKKYELWLRPFSSGGEGDIYYVEGSDNYVAKIYYPERINNELEEKLKVMVQKPPNSTVLSQLAWPLDVLYDEREGFCGFIMPRLSITTDLYGINVYPPKVDIAYTQKLIVAQNICATISEVHKAGYVLGDFNPGNIGVDMKTGMVAFLDTDSYHITSGGTTFRCKVCLDGYVAPELLKKCEAYKKDAYATAPLPTFTKETDNFALAIHIFRLLMNGYTPFNGIKETERPSTASPGVGNQAIRKDAYCFRPGYKPMSPAVPPSGTLPDEIVEMFSRAFITGRDNPKERPTAKEWYKALKSYESTLVRCQKEIHHFYKKGLKECPWCKVDENYFAFKAFIYPDLRIPSSFDLPNTVNTIIDDDWM